MAAAPMIAAKPPGTRALARERALAPARTRR